MKFIGLRVFIAILELIAFVLIVPCLVVIGWALFGGEHPLSGQALTQVAIAIAVVGGVLLMGIVVAAMASLLNLLLAIERNTASAAENAARVGETQTKTETETLSLIRRFPRLQSWHLGAAVLAGVVLVVILVEAFSTVSSRDARVKGVAVGNVAGMEVEIVGRAVVGFKHSQILGAEMRVRLLAGKDSKQKRQIGVIRVQQIQLAKVQRIVAGHGGKVSVQLVVGFRKEIAIRVGEEASELGSELLQFGF